MGMFAQEHSNEEASLSAAPRRMAWTRESGTRRLIAGFGVLLVIMYLGGKVQDHFLLQKSWSALGPDTEGLTVVGTLDGRGNYDRNMFRILNANKSSRVELTDYGWRTVFDGKTELFSDKVGGAIQHARDIDGVAGDALLTPILKAGVAHQMGQDQLRQHLTRDTPVVVPAQEGALEHVTPARTTTIGKLIDTYSGDAAQSTEQDPATSEGGSGSGRSVEHGITLSPDTVINACPVVLNSSSFRDGWLEEYPATVFSPLLFTVHLGLTPEGRSRFFQWSHSHANENLVFVLKHQVVAAGRILETMDVKEWEITNLRDAEGAKALVDFVNARNH